MYTIQSNVDGVVTSMVHLTQTGATILLLVSLVLLFLATASITKTRTVQRSADATKVSHLLGRIVLTLLLRPVYLAWLVFISLAWWAATSMTLLPGILAAILIVCTLCVGYYSGKQMARSDK